MYEEIAEQCVMKIRVFSPSLVPCQTMFSLGMSVWTLLVLALFLAPSCALAAEVRTPDLVLTMPDGWQRPLVREEGGVRIVLVRMEDQAERPAGVADPGSAEAASREPAQDLPETDAGVVRLSITVTPHVLDPEEMARQTAASMKRRGLRVSEPVQTEASWSFAFARKRGNPRVQGRHFFTVSGTQASIVSLLAPDDEGLARACEYLERNLKPARPGLFPKRYAPLEEGTSPRP